MSLTSSSSSIVYSLLKETFESYDINSIFVLSKSSSTVDDANSAVFDVSSIDVKLSPSELTTFIFEEYFSSASPDEIKLPFQNFDSIWKQFIGKNTSTLNIMKSIRAFFYSCRFQRDPRCLRFRESVRFERIFERKLFDLHHHHHQQQQSNKSSGLDLFRQFLCSSTTTTPTQAKVIEAWLSALDYYFYYFPEFRFPVADGQAANYSKVTKNPMSFAVMYSRIRSASPSLNNKRTFFAHLELIARNCINYNGSESLLAMRAHALVETSCFRDAAGHIPSLLQKNFPDSASNNNNSVIAAEKELTFGEDSSLRWFNEALKPGQFVVFTVDDGDGKKSKVGKKNNIKTKNNEKPSKKGTSSTKKKSLGSALQLLEKESGKRRKRAKDDEVESSSEDDEPSDDDDDDDESYDDDNDDANKRKKGNKQIQTSKTNEKVAPEATQNSKTSKAAKRQQVSADQLQDVHSTLLAIWSSVTEQHLPRSEKILLDQQQALAMKSTNNNNNITVSRGTSVNNNNSIGNNNNQHHHHQGYSPSIRRSVTGAMMNNSNNNNNVDSLFTKEAIQELSSLKALADMVEEQMKLLED